MQQQKPHINRPERRLVWLVSSALEETLFAAQWLDTTRELRRMGWQVTLVTSDTADQTSIRGVAVHTIPKPHIFVLGQLLFHLKFIQFLWQRWHSTDVVLFNQLSVPFLLPLRLIRFIRRQRLPLLIMDTRDVNRVHGSLRDSIRGWLYKETQHMANLWADGQTTITPKMAELVRIPPKQLLGIWPSGVNIAPFAQAFAERQWPASGEPIRLIYIGTLNHDRNLSMLCHAVEQANAAGMSFALHLVGSGTEEGTLVEIAKSSGGTIQVDPPVPHAEIPRLLSKAHIGATGVALVEDEVFQASSPIKLMEYMAAGLPLLSSRNVCYTTVVQEGRYAFWIDETSVEGILTTLQEIWSAKEMLSDMGQQATQASHLWSWCAAAGKLNKALRYKLDQRRGTTDKQQALTELIYEQSE